MPDTARAFTDPVTNTTVLTQLDLPDDLRDLLGLGQTPTAALPSFLHEATHHWCFTSPVGYVLAAMQMRIWRNALLVQDGRPLSEVEWELVGDLTRLETAVTALRPIAEGIALFAEFDARTGGRSQSFSMPLELGTFQFGLHEAEDPQDQDLMTKLATRFVVRSRLTPEVLARKVTVLGEPFSCRGEAYLPGYMLVRTLWRDVASRLGLLNESDLFLIFLRAFLYDDAGLIVELLRPVDDELRSAERVGNHILARLDELLDVTAAEVLEWDRVVASGESEAIVAARPTCLHVDRAKAELADELVEELLRWHNDPSLEGLEHQLREVERALLLQREIFYFGAAPVDVSVSDGKVRLSTDGHAIWDGQALESAEEAEGEGFVQLLYWTKRSRKILTVELDGRPIAVHVIPQLEDGDDAPPLGPPREQFRRALDYLRMVTDQVVDDSWLRIPLQHVRRSLAEDLTNAYAHVLLGRHDEPDVASLREHGFFALLGFDRRLIEGAALLGLATSVAPQQDLVEAYFRRFGLDLGLTLEALTEVAERVGIPKPLIADGTIFAGV